MEDKKYPTIAERNKYRKANHLYYELVAETLNDCGVDQRMLLSELKNIGRVRNTKESIKDIYRSIAIQKYPKLKSTQELDTKQAQEVEEEFTESIQTAMKVDLPPFPSQTEIAIRQLFNDIDRA